MDTVFMCYLGGGSVHIQADNGLVWTMDSDAGDFVADVSGWLRGGWSPSEHAAPRTTTQGLVPVAAWSRTGGLCLLVERGKLGPIAGRYLARQ